MCKIIEFKTKEQQLAEEKAFIKKHATRYVRFNNKIEELQIEIDTAEYYLEYCKTSFSQEDFINRVENIEFLKQEKQKLIVKRDNEMKKMEEYIK